MSDKPERKGLQHLFGSNGKAAAEPPEPLEEQENEDLGPCAAIAKNKWITSLTIRHAAKPWESFQYSYIGVRSEFESTRFAVDFVGHDEHYRLVVSGRNLGKLYNLCIQARLEWIRAADRDFGADDEAVITGIEVVKVEEKKR